ncbi:MULTISPECIES: DUF6898 family protein [Pseudovibrio]|uniref:DUF6898 family protein n=1 Tax=Stappiaceae TaxID=2821832 RepID=UPI00236683E2|nr:MULTISPECIES: serine hydroxymethyltransferase [Pseudovibrio]MDD7908384.1 serine hydroxymethyltransferase [Pseudovibrio exalbescens]MDX5592510.1 serine hydroxymethyltransferase [Pseudovibrio sp. SPO723]
MSKPSTIFFELHQVGRYVKVSAICADTGTEVSVVGDPNASQAQLKALAAQKLKRRLERDQKS